MAFSVDIIMQKCKSQLRGLYGWVDHEEANTPGPFTKNSIYIMLSDDSWGDQVVCEGM